jgi:hypothetical protein
VLSTVLLTGLATVLLAGCAVGRPQAFTARSNSFCSDALIGIGKLRDPHTPLEQMQYALDRYTLVEKAVSELTDSSLPGGSTGDELRTKWLRPARAALTQGRTVLAGLREVIHDGDSASITRAFDVARNIGTEGTDTSLLRTRGLNRCASLFSPSGSS